MAGVGLSFSDLFLSRTALRCTRFPHLSLASSCHSSPSPKQEWSVSKRWMGQKGLHPLCPCPCPCPCPCLGLQRHGIAFWLHLDRPLFNVSRSCHPVDSLQWLRSMCTAP